MAQLAIALAASGAASYGVSAGLLAATYFNGMSTVGIAWSLGSMVGSMLTGGSGGQDAQGPRLADKSVQGSSYGEFIPITYGSMRVSGNIIWATDLVEVATVEEAGGKGSESSEYTTYSYYANFATLLCEGPIDAVQRIWADGRLVYDTSVGSTKKNGFAKYFKFYKGTEDQLPDAFIESKLGVGNVPAYRGRAYVRFKKLPLAKYGNRIPNLTFEVIRGPQYLPDTTFVQTDSGKRGFSGRYAIDKETDRAWLTDRVSKDGILQNYIKCTNFRTGALIYEHYFLAENIGGINYYFKTPVSGRNELSSCVYVPVTNEVWIAPFSSIATFFWVHDADTGKFKFYVYKFGGSWMQMFVYDENTKCVLLFSNNFSTRVVTYDPQDILPFVYDPFAGGTPTTTLPVFTTTSSTNDFQEVARAKKYLFTDETGTPYYTSYMLACPVISVADCYVTDVLFGGPIGVIQNTTQPITCLHDKSRDLFALFLRHETDSSKFYIKIIETEPPFNTIKTKELSFSNGSMDTGICIYLDYIDKYVLLNSTTSFSIALFIDPDSLEIDYFYYWSSVFGTAPNNTSFTIGNVAETNYNYLIGTVSSTSVNEFSEIPTQQVTSDQAAVLSTIVSDISTRVGLLPSQINVSGMTDEVPGYIITKQAPARAALEPLLTAYFYDSVESST